jgi:excinuclease ABC subunit C
MSDDSIISTASGLTGAALIADEVRRLPDAPGVYRMIGDEAEVLYVGKARSLKKRVIQYAQGRFHTNRIATMVNLTRAMEFVSTKTETDALLLESNLIKRLKPRFNVVSYRDDKSFPNILLRGTIPSRSSRSIAAPRPSRASISAHSPRRAPSTAPSTPCSAPSCCGPARIRSSKAAPGPACCSRSSAAGALRCIDLAGYHELVEEAERFLKGKSQAVQDELKAEMTKASDAWISRRPRNCATG